VCLLVGVGWVCLMCSVRCCRGMLVGVWFGVENFYWYLGVVGSLE